MSDLIAWDLTFSALKRSRIKTVQPLDIKIVLQVAPLWAKIKIVKFNLQAKDSGKKYKIIFEPSKVSNLDRYRSILIH